jgi:hypothetical protein
LGGLLKEGMLEMTTAARNRQIKKTLEQAFGRGKVQVRGSLGTAYGLVSVHITYSPRNVREQQELRTQIMTLLNTAKIEIGTYGYDDPGSDYGYGKTIHINFDPCREQADYYGPVRWRHELDSAKWDEVSRLDALAAKWTPETARCRVGGTFGT